MNDTYTEPSTEAAPLPPVETTVPAAKPPLRIRLKKLTAEYGNVALVTYLTLSVSAIVGFSLAIGFGFGADSAGDILGTIGAGWLAAKATMPLRILATLALTPLIAKLLERRRKARGEDNDDLEDDA